MIAKYKSQLIFRVWLLLVAVILMGLGFTFVLQQMGFDDSMRDGIHTVFYYLFVQNERLQLSVLLGACVLLGLLIGLPVKEDWLRISMPPRAGVWITLLAACVVLAASWLGTFLFFHNYDLSMDEFAANFQGSMFSSGRWYADIASEWRVYAKALTPDFLNYYPERHIFIANYLPGYALIRGLFIWLQVPSLLNPLLSSGAVLLVAATARNLWPEKPLYPALGAALLVSMPVVLINAMSVYSMPANLFFNLLWLYCYTRKDWLGYALAPWIGGCALLVHQPFPHFLFVTPFLLNMVWKGRWAMSAYYAFVYLLGGGCCVAWWELVSYPGAVATGVSLFHGLDSAVVMTQLMNLAVIVSWSSPIVLILFILSFYSERKADSEIFNCLRWGCGFVFVFYTFIIFTQGHGWGYRYFYPAWGNVLILALLGWDVLGECLPGAKIRIFLAMSLILAWAVQLPIRVWQVERFVRPYAQSEAYLQQLDAEVILLDRRGIWYGRDLVRNNPFLSGVKIMDRADLSESEINLIKEKYRTVEIGYSELSRFGVKPALPCVRQKIKEVQK